MEVSASTPTSNRQVDKEPECAVPLPREVLETLLSNLPFKDLVTASEVCRSWNEIIRDRGFWRNYYSKNKKHLWDSIRKRVDGHADEWMVHMAVTKFDPFGRNLLTNPFLLQGFSGWNILSGDASVRVETTNEDGSPVIDLMYEPDAPGWTIQTNPQSIIREFPEGLGPTSCFATDGFSCSMDQRIDLWKVGITPPVIRACVPFVITYSAFVGSPEGYGGFHEMYVRLLNRNGLQMHSNLYSNLNESQLIGTSSPFRKYSGSLTIKPENADMFLQLRYIYFYHGAMARENVSGTIGPHIYNPSVVIELI